MLNEILGMVGLKLVRAKREGLPVEASEQEKRILASVARFSMTTPQRLWALISAVKYIVQSGVAGDFVECGVWRGGSVMAMAMQLQLLGGADQNIWLYDTFDGMTDPTENDVEALTGAAAKTLLEKQRKDRQDSVWCAVGIEEVRRNVFSTGYPSEQFRFVEGDVSETVKLMAPEKISLLRLDTDWYESTRDELEVLYPRLQKGGVCILDDYGYWQGARRAVDEYFDSLGFKPLMHVIDFAGRVLIKT